MRIFANLQDLAASKGEDLGVTDWLTVDQQMVNTFADATGDHQWIHVDPEKAAGGPFGGTIAHGFLTLSLLPRLWIELYMVDNISMAVNYGLNKVRFPSPVLVGARIRAAATVADVEDLGGSTQLTLATTVEIEGGAKPACVAEGVVRFFP